MSYDDGRGWIEHQCGITFSQEQKRCAEVLCSVARPYNLRVNWARFRRDFDAGHSNYLLVILGGGGLSTYDNDSLTRLVKAAHEHCVRVEIEGAGPRYLRVWLHARKVASGANQWERHPTVAQAFGVGGTR